jgi:hypothetical protein
MEQESGRDRIINNAWAKPQRHAHSHHDCIVNLFIGIFCPRICTPSPRTCLALTASCATDC